MADRPPNPSPLPVSESGGMRTALVALVVLVTALVGWRLLGPRFFAANSAVPPDTRLTELDLTPLTPTSPPLALDDLRGKVTLVNFWGTWCPPCVEEFPHLAAIEKQYRGNAGFHFVSISLGYGEPQDLEEVRAATRAFLARGGYDLPVYADPQGRTLDGLKSAIEIGGVPLTLLVDRDGTITNAWIGFTTAAVDEMRLRLATLLGPK